MDWMQDNVRVFDSKLEADQYAELSWPKFKRGMRGARYNVIALKRISWENVLCDSCLEWASQCSCRRWPES